MEAGTRSVLLIRSGINATIAMTIACSSSRHWHRSAPVIKQDESEEAFSDQTEGSEIVP